MLRDESSGIFIPFSFWRKRAFTRAPRVRHLIYSCVAGAMACHFPRHKFRGEEKRERGRMCVAELQIISGSLALKKSSAPRPPLSRVALASRAGKVTKSVPGKRVTTCPANKSKNNIPLRHINPFFTPPQLRFMVREFSDFTLKSQAEVNIWGG